MLRLLIFCFLAALSVCSNITCDELPRNSSISYFFHVEDLKKNEQWNEIVRLGEIALHEKEMNGLSVEQQFQITDQLVSSYFRLGLFEKAREQAEALISLGDALDQPAMIIDSLYKFSAAIRGQAGNVSDTKLFETARNYAQKALRLCDAEIPSDRLLKAKVLFNAGAAECDDLDGNLTLGIAYYQEALSIFLDAGETDYQYRTQLRLGKAWLLCNDVNKSAEIVEQLKQCPLEERTLMHWHYLQAQVLIKQNRDNEALVSIQTGINMAKKLNAQADLRRFELLFETAYAYLKISDDTIQEE